MVAERTCYCFDVPEMGNAFACSTFCEQVYGKGEEAFPQVAALKLERDGLYLLGRCLHAGRGCEQDSQRAKENFLIAAELGHVYAIDYYVRLLNESNHARCYWLIKAAWRGWPQSFLGSFSIPVLKFFWHEKKCIDCVFD